MVRHDQLAGQGALEFAHHRRSHVGWGDVAAELERRTECPEGEVPNLTVGDDDTLKLDIPEEISDHEWKILSIYDDPAANDETAHGANETTEVSIPGSVDPIKASTGKRPRLKVVEISSMMIGTDDNGDETPLATVWSLTTMTDKERQASAEDSTKASD